MEILDKCVPMWAVLVINLGAIGGMARNRKVTYVAIALMAVLLLWRIVA